MTIDPVMLLFALAAPLFLWPIEFYFPFPFVVEEIVKGSFVLKYPNTVNAVFIGIFFTLSETSLYLFNLTQSDSFFIDFAFRLLTTGALHVTTLLLMAFAIQKNKKFFIPGLFLAMLIHYFYNKFLGYPTIFFTL